MKIISIPIIFLINTLITQCIAWWFEYSAAFGPSIQGVYWPWKWISWYYSYSHLYPQIFYPAATICMFSSCSVIALFFGLKKGSHLVHDLHGSAKWASKQDIVRSGLIPKSEHSDGVYVGGWCDGKKQYYLRHNGPEHILAFAPTRSGKGIGLVIPTLLSWEQSCVVLDIKGENWALTSGWRKKHVNNLVLKFDPSASDESSVKFNPLEEIRLGTDHEVSDVQNIVTMIVDPDGKGLNDHWAKTGHALLVGSVLHSLYTEKEKGRTATLRSVSTKLSDPDTPIDELFEEMLNTKHRDGKVHPVVAESARDMLNKAENERSGVHSTAMSFLTLYRDPIVAKNTAKSEFKIRDLMNHEKPISLYIVVRPSDKDRLKPLIRLLINQIVRILTEKMEFKDGSSIKHYKHRLLLMIDEFPSLGKLEIFEESLAFIAGYGLKAYLITQDLAQLYKHYGKDESIVSNCHIRIAYAPNKIETAELLSKMAGQTTVVKKSVTTSGTAKLWSTKSKSESLQEVQRPLLTPDECMTLKGPQKDHEDKITKPGDMLIFSAGFPAILGTQILYFLDPIFSSRAKIKAPNQSDDLKSLSKPKKSSGERKFELT